jgi:1,4-dihydroxy-2-naphthoate octaprenyltransferase
VFIFFGLVAVMGSAYVQEVGWSGRVMTVDFLAATVVGLLATALLEANNLRDVTGDRASGKRTLAVRVGRHRAGWLYLGPLLVAAACVVGVSIYRPWALLGLLALPLGVKPAQLALGESEGRDLLPMLGATGRIQLVVGLLLAVGIVL